MGGCVVSYAILARNPSNQRLVAIHDGDENVAEFETFGKAVEATEYIPVCRAWPYVIVETP